MRTLMMGFTLLLVVASMQAQDSGMQAAQQAQMAAQQATQQAIQQTQMASQQASQAMQNAQQAAMRNSGCDRCSAKPKFSLKSGTYSSGVMVRINSTRGAVIYYTTDGWTPTAASNQYSGPIAIDSTTTLQAIAIWSNGPRSRVATAVYTLNGVSATSSAGMSAPATSNAVAAGSSSGKLLLAQGTAVPLVFTSDLSSRTAGAGDKISLTLAEDLKAGDVILVRKGTPSVATVTEVDKPRMMGVPGEVFFQVNDLQADGALVKLRGSAAREGQGQEVKAGVLLVAVPVVPVALFVHGKDAEIKQGTPFTAFVDTDTSLSPAN
jgi:Chitobiase/beta-hexosaminidase C-terminal domain